MVTAVMVKELREKTGAGMMDCKKVLTETNGDIEKAMELLRERGITKAAKKADRIAAEGMVAAYVTLDKKTGAIVEVNSETDFVAKNDDFRLFVLDLAEQIATKKPATVEELLAQESTRVVGKTVNEVLTEKISTIGEHMIIRRFSVFESENLVESYIHGDGKIGVLVDLKKGKTEIAKDIAMQVAAVNPKYLNRESVPLDIVEKEMESLKNQAMNEGKPADIAEKMVKGRINKFYGEICLVEQQFVKDPDNKISDVLKQNDAEVANFVRFEKGEGIEKKQENFAEEVMKQINK